MLKDIHEIRCSIMHALTWPNLCGIQTTWAKWEGDWWLPSNGDIRICRAFNCLYTYIYIYSKFYWSRQLSIYVYIVVMHKKTFHENYCGQVLILFLLKFKGCVQNLRQFESGVEFENSSSGSERNLFSQANNFFSIR